MPESDPERPTTNQPLHGERRPLVTPTLAVLAIFAVMAAAFVLVTWARYGT